MDDDFHTPRAIASLFDMIRQLNGFMEKGVRDPFLGRAARRIRELAGVMGFMKGRRDIHFIGDGEWVEVSPEEYQEARERMESAVKGDTRPEAEDIRTVLLWRAQARKRGDWRASDEIRNWLKGVGVSVEDARDGFYWKYKHPEKG